MGIGESLLIIVKDSGSGIDTEIMPLLFTKFASKSFQGIEDWDCIFAKVLLKIMEGKIWAENDKDGNGVFFTLVYH